eukprot:3194391-Ditylum_brightwellii.AAC.1
MVRSTTMTVLVLSVAISALVFCEKCWQTVAYGRDDENNKEEEEGDAINFGSDISFVTTA